MARVAYRKSRQNRIGMILAALLVFTIMAVVFVKGVEIKEKQAVYSAKEKELEEKIIKEEERAVEIEEYATYTQTKKYIEEIAREKLGLVYEGEILFKDEQ